MAIGVGIKAKKNLVNIWLVGFFLSSAAVFYVKILYGTGMILDHPHWFKVNYPTGLVRSIFIFLYVHYLLKGIQSIRIKDFLHFLPVLLLVLYLLPVFSQSSEFKMGLLNRQIENPPGIIPSWYIYFQFSYSLLYVALIYYDLDRYIRDHPSLNRAQKNVVRWIRFLMWGGIIFLSSALIIRVFDLTGNFNYYVYELFSILLIILCIKLLTLPKIIDLSLDQSEKYVKSRLSKRELEDYFKQINEILRDQKIYTNSNLKVKDLALELKLPEYMVSQIINQKSGQTFRSLINTYRISAAKEMLINARDQYSIEGIAKQVGFSSRTSFYTAFKKETGRTPTGFLKSTV